MRAPSAVERSHTSMARPDCRLIRLIDTAAVVGDAPLLAGGVGVGLLGDVGAAGAAGDLEEESAVAGLDADVAVAGVDELELLVGRAVAGPLDEPRAPAGWSRRRSRRPCRCAGRPGVTAPVGGGVGSTRTRDELPPGVRGRRVGGEAVTGGEVAVEAPAHPVEEGPDGQGAAPVVAVVAAEEGEEGLGRRAARRRPAGPEEYGRCGSRSPWMNRTLALTVLLGLPMSTQAMGIAAVIRESG